MNSSGQSRKADMPDADLDEARHVAFAQVIPDSCVRLLLAAVFALPLPREQRQDRGFSLKMRPCHQGPFASV
jgi:hypothetical protein